MSYQIPSGDIVIAYEGTSYEVTLTSDPTQFRIKSPVDGSPMPVSLDTAAALFGAENAILVLNNLYGNNSAAQYTSSWNAQASAIQAAVIQDITATSLADISGAFAGAAANLISEEGSGLLLGAVSTIQNLTYDNETNVAALYLMYGALNSASQLLNQSYQSDLNIDQSIANSSYPISYDLIKATIDNTLISMATAYQATTAMSQLPALNQSTWDAISHVLQNFAASIISFFGPEGLSEDSNALKAVLAGVPGYEITALDKSMSLYGLISNGVINQNEITDIASSIFSGLSSAGFPALGQDGLKATADQLQSLDPQVLLTAQSQAFSINPSVPIIDEDSGSVQFVISRAGNGPSENVYISTVDDLGATNADANYYYAGITNLPITLAGGQSATINLHINGLGLTGGSETFRLIVQQNASDPISTSLASTTFTILNSDPAALPAARW
jgi:hypothetical protein